MHVMMIGMSKTCSGLQVTLAMHQSQFTWVLKPVTMIVQANALS